MYEFLELLGEWTIRCRQSLVFYTHVFQPNRVSMKEQINYGQIVFGPQWIAQFWRSPPLILYWLVYVIWSESFAV